MCKGFLFRTAAIVMTLLLVLALFAGCGNKAQEAPAGTEKETTSDGNQDSPQEKKEAPAEKKEVVTIEFWHHYNAESNENKILTEVLIPEFQAKFSHIKVEAASHEWANLHDKMLVSANSNQLPNVVRADSAWIPEFQALNMLVAIDKEMQDFSQVAAMILEGPMNTAKVKGNYYGLGLNTNSKVLFYNKKLLEESGVSVPETLDQFFEAAKTLTKKVKGRQVWGYAEPAFSGWNICPFIWSNGGDITDPEQNVASGYVNSQSNIEIIQKLADLYKSGALTGFNSGDIPMTDGFAQGRYAMIIDGPWKFAELSGGHADFKDYAVAPMPAGKGGSIQVLGGEDISMCTGANKEAAWEFMKFMTGKYAQVEMAKAGQIPVNKEAIDDPEVRSLHNFAPFLEAIKTAGARPAVSVWPKMDAALQNAVLKAILGEMPVKEALDEAAAQMDELLKQK